MVSKVARNLTLSFLDDNIICLFANSNKDESLDMNFLDKSEAFG
jgi:hypothetical protein